MPYVQGGKKRGRRHPFGPRWKGFYDAATEENLIPESITTGAGGQATPIVSNRIVPSRRRAKGLFGENHHLPIQDCPLANSP
jgi:hypothetical protein